MKLTRRFPAVLLALALCLGLLSGCASGGTSNGAGAEIGQTSNEGDVYAVNGLELTRVDDTISTMEYLSCNGKTLVVPVFQGANWDNVRIAEDKTFVEVTNTSGEVLANLDGVYYCTYYSEEQAYYDLEDMAQQYSEAFEDAEICPRTISEDGSVQAIAVHGLYQGNEIYQYMVTIDHDDEYAVMDLSFYTSNPSMVEPLLDYWSVPNPAAG